MKRKFLYSLFAILLINTVFIGCKRDLTVIPNGVLVTSDIYTDKSLITSVLARFYEQINNNPWTGPNQNPNPGGAAWGASNATDESFQQNPDDAVNNRGAASAGQVQFANDIYRTFDYGLIRRINQFLVGIRSAPSQAAMSPTENANFEGQALFLRAWTFFHMVKSLGGLTIVGDNVFDFAGGTDVTPLQLQRNSEADCYDYIIAQCDLAATKLTNTSSANGTIPATQNINAALANKWAALMLKARAAITAASIAKFDALYPGDPLLWKTDRFGNQTHGIPLSKADGYYATAYAAAKAVIDGGVYSIMTGSDLASAQQAFQNAINNKNGNTEAIWTTDRQALPGLNTSWTVVDGPYTHNESPSQGNQLGAGAEFVESFEDRVPGVQGPQGIPTRTTSAALLTNEGGVNNTPIMYDLSDPNSNPFMKKDARIYASVIWPNAPFKGTPVDLRAGEWRGEYNTDGTLKVYTSAPGPKAAITPYNLAYGGTQDATKAAVLTSINGPFEGSSATVSKTGFIPRKWLDETPGASLSPNLSAMWVIHFRLAEAYAICAEAALLSAPLGGAAVGVTYINVLRARGLLAPLTAAQFDFNQLVREDRIEFYMEDHRLWDMNRWRLADQYWDGVTCSKCSLYPNGTSYPWQMYAYVVNIPGNPGNNNGKWVFERKKAFRKRANPNSFQRSSYYSTMTKNNGGTGTPNWLTYNPNWEKNPSDQ